MVKRPLLQKVIDILAQRNWHRYPDEKPSESGWYQCTIAFTFCDNPYKIQSYVMDLWYDTKNDKFKDNRRQNVYETYDVMGYQHGNEKAKMYHDKLCDRTSSVVAWQPLAPMFRIPKGMKVNVKE